MNLETLTAFLGWCAVINLLLLVVVSIGVMTLREPVMKIHSRMVGVSESELPLMYFKYVAYFKIAVFVFNVTPWIALKVIAQ